MKTHLIGRRRSLRSSLLGMAARVLVVAGVLGVPTWLAACNTTEGFGKDVKNLGSNIEQKAEEKKND